MTGSDGRSMSSWGAKASCDLFLDKTGPYYILLLNVVASVAIAAMLQAPITTMTANLLLLPTALRGIVGLSVCTVVCHQSKS